jgi:hypothetical protein
MSPAVMTRSMLLFSGAAAVVARCAGFGQLDTGKQTTPEGVCDSLQCSAEIHVSSRASATAVLLTHRNSERLSGPRSGRLRELQCDDQSLGCSVAGVLTPQSAGPMPIWSVVSRSAPVRHGTRTGPAHGRVPC